MASEANTAPVPTIDISPLFERDGDVSTKMAVAQEIRAACLGSGFFFAANHGIDVNRFVEVVETFHNTMTHAEKFDLAIRAYNKTNNHIRNGYYMAIPGKKAPESFCYLNPSFNEDYPYIANGDLMHEINDWPNEEKHAGFQEFCEDHYWKMFELASILLRGFALALGKNEEFFDQFFCRESTLSSVSLIRYPFIEDYPEKAIKIAPDGTKLSFEDHLDVSLITILYQTPVPNLQVEMADGLWMDVSTSSTNLLINCGTYMDHVTNGCFPAPNHRVKFVNAERFSLPFFVNLGHESVIEPFWPGQDENEESEKNLPLSYGEYLTAGLHKLIVKNGQT